jgi:hypothetical protein
MTNEEKKIAQFVQKHREDFERSLPELLQRAEEQLREKFEDELQERLDQIDELTPLP